MKTDYCAECPKVNKCNNRGNTECETYRRIEEGLKKNKITSAYDVGSCVVYIFTKIFVGLLLLAILGGVCIAVGMFVWTDQIPSIFSNMVFNWALVGFLLIFGSVLLFFIGCLIVCFFQWLFSKWLDMFFNGQEKMEKLRWK